MPKMPKWLGDLSEKIFSNSYKPTTISEIEYYYVNCKRVRFQGDSLKNIDWKPAQEIEFRVTNTEYRHYTPSVWNAEKGYVDVIFYLHGKGVGSNWARNLKPGDKINLIGPGGKFIFAKNTSHIVMLGDETTLGAFYGMQQMITDNHQFTCVLEVCEEAKDWANKIGLQADSLVTIPSKKGKVLMDWLHSFLHNNSTAQTSDYYISGNARTIQNLKKILLAQKISIKNIYTKPYWLENKKGL
ncbi:siderophore-interacting protein [Weeksellaceae bacterium TAE3-ERU29]|nr:siderophore-interacting protein [Weeksellaceae bacterium TAE3-ERU29]